MKIQASFIETQVEQELTNLKACWEKVLQIPTHTPLQHLVQSIRHLPGKHLRARLVFLVAGAHGMVTDQTRRGATLVTLIHQASLLHDDVIDEAKQRRGNPSVNATWGNRKAILLGDYLLTHCINLAISHQDYNLLLPLVQTTQAMTEGELLQLSQINPLSVTEDICLEIIHKKTASLMGTCSMIGALSSSQPTEQQVSAMRHVGENLGMAFQIQDDLLDYGVQENLDKEIGMDIKSGKITLPLFYALQQAKDST
ncbi:MAG: polyprenyl synthetase family protein, partial [Burkholderiales bacterium]